MYNDIQNCLYFLCTLPLHTWRERERERGRERERENKHIGRLGVKAK